MLVDYNCMEYLQYAGTNTGHIYDFLVYIPDDDGNLNAAGERRLTAGEIKKMSGGEEFLQEVER